MITMVIRISMSVKPADLRMEFPLSRQRILRSGGASAQLRSTNGRFRGPNGMPGHGFAAIIHGRLRVGRSAYNPPLVPRVDGERRAGVAQLVEQLIRNQ